MRIWTMAKRGRSGALLAAGGVLLTLAAGPALVGCDRDEGAFEETGEAIDDAADDAADAADEAEDELE